MNYELRLAQVLPETGVRLADYLRVVDAQTVQTEGSRSEGHCHAMVFVGINSDSIVPVIQLFAVPIELTIVHVVHHIAQLEHLLLQRFYAVRFLDFQRR